ncbi:hypothetical protein AKJ18_08945 [Vibrio xuii]|nr:hypothetical protein AKJ18_08945 [Vibrio xuii]
MKINKLLLMLILCCLSLGSVSASDELAIEPGKTTVKEFTDYYGEPKQTVTIDDVDLLIYSYDEQHDLTLTFSNKVLVEYQLTKWDVDGEITVTPID